LGPFIKLSVASGVMLCLELWYQKIVVLMAVKLKDTDVAVDSFSICLNINSWEMAIPLGFLVSNSVRVANEPGATVILHNAKVVMFRGSMRLSVDRWGRVEPSEDAKFEAKEDSNLSLIEFEVITVVD
ncbi:hypothetical protein KI387_041311, partial [Taxus chinensis]